MKIAYFDCFSGAAGDMIVGACLDAGADEENLRGELGKLGLHEVQISIEKVSKNGIQATAFNPQLKEKSHKHRHLPTILDIINSADLSVSVKERATAVFRKLADAEAKVHGTSPDKVHFHEVGAADAIVDIVGAAVALESLDVDQVLCSALAVGGGTVECEHGIMPVPAPATAEMIKGIALAPSTAQEELLTPTGAAILTTLSRSFGPLPAMAINHIGYGAGQKDIPNSANVLRLLIGQAAATTAPGFPQDQVLVLETNLDDVTAETTGHAMDRLLAAGALDVYLQAAQMKKNRPGCLLTVLCRTDDQEKMEEILFSETATFGVRRMTWNRSILHRRHESVDTPYGPIRIKIGHKDDRIYATAPEFDDCQKAAAACNVPLRTVYHAARTAFQND
jgi:hypothetical protein